MGDNDNVCRSDARFALALAKIANGYCFSQLAIVFSQLEHLAIVVLTACSGQSPCCEEGVNYFKDTVATDPLPKLISEWSLPLADNNRESSGLGRDQ